MSVDLESVRRIVTEEHGLCSVTVVRADGAPHSSLVNAGVLDHPRTTRRSDQGVRERVTLPTSGAGTLGSTDASCNS